MRLDRISKGGLQRSILAAGLLLFFNAVYAFPLSSAVYLFRAQQTSCCKIKHSCCCRKDVLHHHSQDLLWGSQPDCPRTCGFPMILSARVLHSLPSQTFSVNQLFLIEASVSSTDVDPPLPPRFPTLYQRPPPTC
jgi:hypothetical protein